MKLGIHKTILQRLFIGWFFISIAVGGAVFFAEMRWIDQRVLDLALEESATFRKSDPVRFGRPDAAYLQALRQKSQELVQSHFLVVELYNIDRQMILQTVAPGGWEIESRLSRYMHQFPRGGDLSFNSFYIDKQLVLQALVPLRDRKGKQFGYFEGVYRVEPETLRHLQRDVVRVLVLVIIVITITSALLYPVILALNRGLIALAHDLLKSNVALMATLGSAIAQRDSDTNAHNYRVTIYAARLAQALKLDRAAIRDLMAGAFLHDVGKIGISDNILLKPGPLTEEEATAMHSHVARGLDIISRAEWLGAARAVIASHHERYDGTGYPQGLKGDAIPLNARIFAIVDVFDALTSRRPYKDALPFAAAMDMLRQGSGSHFDPALLGPFEGIAARLYAALHDADEGTLKSELDGLVESYLLS